MRTTSNDIQIIEEVFRFLQANDLEFLVEYFTGEHCKTNLRQLRDMSDEDLEKLFEGPLYATRIRQELNRIFEN